MKQVFAILSVMLLIIGCDSDAGTGGDGNGNGYDAHGSNPGVDSYIPPEDGNEPPEDGSDPPADAGTSLVEEVSWMKNQWVRKDSIPTGPYEVNVDIEQRNGVYITGLYPGEDGLPIEKIDDDTYRIYYEDIDGEGEIEAILPKNCTEFELYLRLSADQEKIFIYSRP